MSYPILDDIGFDNLFADVYTSAGDFIFQYSIELNRKLYLKEYLIVGMLDELEEIEIKYFGNNIDDGLNEMGFSLQKKQDFYNELLCFGYCMLQDNFDSLIDLVYSAKSKILAENPYINFHYNDIYVISKYSGKCILVKKDISYNDLLNLINRQGYLYVNIMGHLGLDYIDI